VLRRVTPLSPKHCAPAGLCLAACMPRVCWEWFAGWCVISVAWHCWSCRSLLQLFMPALSARCGVACVLRLRGALIPKNKQKNIQNTNTQKKHALCLCGGCIHVCAAHPLSSPCHFLSFLASPCLQLSCAMHSLTGLAPLVALVVLACRLVCWACVCAVAAHSE
jgi:hypothetical protein